MEDDDYVVLTKSYIDVEDFKYNLERKRQIVSKLRNSLMLPVIVYVKNPDITDISKTIYIMMMYQYIDNLLEKIKCYMNNEDENTKYILKTESGDEQTGILGDVILLEIYQEYKNRDGFLYLILDKE